MFPEVTEEKLVGAEGGGGRRGGGGMGGWDPCPSWIGSRLGENRIKFWNKFYRNKVTFRSYSMLKQHDLLGLQPIKPNEEVTNLVEC